MKTRLSKSDFDFIKVGHGHWEMRFTSPNTGKTWSVVDTNAVLVDEFNNLNYYDVSQKKLHEVKSYIKRMCEFKKL